MNANNQIVKTFKVINIFLMVCAMGCLVFYDYHGGLWLKGVTSSWFVLLGLVNIIYAHKAGLKNMKFLILMEMGLFFGMCADVLLGIEFMLGLICFALGHVIYMVAFFSIEKVRKQDFMIILPIAAVSLFFVTGTPFINVEDPFMEKLILGYAVIIAFMLGKAVSNAAACRSKYRIIIAVGCACFWFSDMMLAIDMFGEASRMTWILCSYTYWPAQNLLAHSLYHYVREKKSVHF